ncbi:hypothetical protein, partial [Noviherbaspirillum pedocola]|uniref:hypothetical protein n=1 Tax=Noviherbaspirillum pedocola TaxID=2801341 RepID=UPI001F2ADB3A
MSEHTMPGISSLVTFCRDETANTFEQDANFVIPEGAEGSDAAPLACAIAQAGGAGAEPPAVKLDTRILEGNPFTSLRPEQIPYSSSEYSGRAINYPLYEKPVHFRAKVQEFSGGGFEVVISSV